MASAAAEIRQLGIDAQSSPVPQQKVGVRMHRNTNHTRWQAKRSRRQAVSQSGSQAPKDPIEEPPARASRRRAAADSNPPTTQETTEAAPEEVPPQRVTRARARRPKSDAPATHVVTRKTRARARRGAKTDAERPSIAVAASELGDVGTTVGVLEQIVEEHESPAAPSSAPPSPPPMASPEREAAALDAPSPRGTPTSHPNRRPSSPPWTPRPRRPPCRLRRSAPPCPSQHMCARSIAPLWLGPCLQVAAASGAPSCHRARPTTATKRRWRLPHRCPRRLLRVHRSSLPRLHHPWLPMWWPPSVPFSLPPSRSHRPSPRGRSPSRWDTSEFQRGTTRALQVKALAAAEAARQREAEREAQRARQREELDRQRKERHKVCRGDEVHSAATWCHRQSKQRRSGGRPRIGCAGSRHASSGTRTPHGALWTRCAVHAATHAPRPADDRPRPGTVLEAKRRLEETRKQVL